jgi:hypothetical protein
MPVRTPEEAFEQRLITREQLTAIQGVARTMRTTFEYVGDIGSDGVGDHWFQSPDGRINAHITPGRSHFDFGGGEHFTVDHTTPHHSSTHYLNRRLVDSGSPEPHDRHWVFDHRSHLPCDRTDEDDLTTAPHLRLRSDRPMQRHINLHQATDPGTRAPGPCMVM